MVLLQNCMDDPLRHLPGYALRRASAAMLADLNKRLEKVYLRHTDAAVLVLIGANAGVTQSALGQMLAIQRANMAPMIAKLEARNLISRSPVDGRSDGIFLTRTGKTVLRSTRSIMDAHEAALLARVPEELRNGLLPALSTLF
jgi:DNA-binding MarR family transcriptional regulator